jgi:ribonuclease-3
LADAFEALCGALYLEAGFARLREILLGVLEPALAALEPAAAGDADEQKDAKTRLQEWLQGRGLALPRYSVVSIDGESHAQVFEVSCAIDALHLSASGSGMSRRRAEQVAAQALLAQLPT